MANTRSSPGDTTGTNASVHYSCNYELGHFTFVKTNRKAANIDFKSVEDESMGGNWSTNRAYHLCTRDCFLSSD
ncbi:hypothetical protein JCM33374_g2272 [Metschnikowia sp. JCM 33374]|nr:hypothetical protein JCM33374_g2272 [Metschnikowia sp. JCM 33374]